MLGHVLSIVLIAALRLADGAADDNTAAHQFMCRLTALAATPVEPPAIEADAGGVMTTLEQLNASTSDIKWQAMFDTSEANAKGERFPESGPAVQHKKEWQQAWPLWWRAFKTAREAKIGFDDNADYKRILDKSQLAALHSLVEALAAEATTVNAKYLAAKTKATVTEKETAQKALTAALYGGDGTKSTVARPATIAAGTSYAAVCTKTATGKSIIGDFFCLCNAAAASTKVCTDAYNGENWSGSVTATDAQWTALQRTCPATQTEQPSPENIQGLLAAFTTALTQKSNSGELYVRLGKSEDHTCDGTSNKVCVDYSDHFKKNSGKGIQAIAWVKKLQEAATALRRMYSAAHLAEAYATQLMAYKANADAAYEAAIAGKLVRAAAAANQASKDKTTVSPVAGSNCAEYRVNKTCTENDCKWDSTTADKGEHCKPKDRKEQKTKGTRDGAAAANAKGKKCSEKTKQEDCKDGCKWDGKECKDFSFLVNKKLAMSMAAAFVSLVVF
uniref:Variant surface glycoprotein 473 n=1 Tax=Trypanosoma brucei TaxID=5691 RepID=M4SX47_9TRYP|nr:variant surface glycoprotein 473 [Trypanosoma brucei]